MSNKEDQYYFKKVAFDESVLQKKYNEVKVIVQSPKERVEIKYPVIKNNDKIWEQHKGQIINDNKSVLESCRNRAGIYGIHITPNAGSAELKYIGQTTDKTSLMRIVNHLIYKHKNTGAKLENIRNAVASGAKIELVFVEISPKELREYVEHKLIADLSPEWNQKK